MEIPDRTCGLCGETNIPRGIDWPWWHDGKPVHPTCLAVLSDQLDSAGD